MWAYSLGVQALYNEVKKALFGNDEEFDRVMGKGSGIIVFNESKGPFNFAANNSTRQRVGFLDEYQLWGPMSDAVYGDLRAAFKLERSTRILATNMIENFISCVRHLVVLLYNRLTHGKIQ